MRNSSERPPTIDNVELAALGHAIERRRKPRGRQRRARIGLVVLLVLSLAALYALWS